MSRVFYIIQGQELVSELNRNQGLICWAEEEAAGLSAFASQGKLDGYSAKIETEMREAAKKFEFEKAAKLRDTIKELREKQNLFG